MRKIVPEKPKANDGGQTKAVGTAKLADDVTRRTGQADDVTRKD